MRTHTVNTKSDDNQLHFQGIGRRRIDVDFDAGRTTSDGGLLLLRQVALRMRLFERLAQCFIDYRNQAFVEHTTEELVSQRILGIACGYEDLDDHDTLRDDPLFAAAAGKRDLTGQHRRRARDRGHALAGKSTLNRLELTPEGSSSGSRYKKIECRSEDVDRLLVDLFCEAYDEPPKEIMLDLDATDDPLHGDQEGRFFHGYYRCYCYLPLYIFCGDELLCARLRKANIDGAAGAVEEVERIVAQVRERWPNVKVTIRADSGFARDALMTWCERNDVDYVLGLAKNSRLSGMIAGDLDAMKKDCETSERPAKCYSELEYRTRDSWSRSRRVIAKAEHLPGKANPRFVVTSLTGGEAKALYEELYCARGDMENRIKEQQLDMFADRTSTATIRGNQLRLYFASLAYVLVNALRRVGLSNTRMASAQCGTIRTRLLKIGGVLRCSVRRLHVSLCTAFPSRDVFVAAHEAIRRWAMI